jgi:hypothetical protein
LANISDSNANSNRRMTIKMNATKSTALQKGGLANKSNGLWEKNKFEREIGKVASTNGSQFAPELKNERLRYGHRGTGGNPLDRIGNGNEPGTGRNAQMSHPDAIPAVYDAIARKNRCNRSVA